MLVSEIQEASTGKHTRIKFHSLEYGRFSAALLVCMFHASGTVATFQDHFPFDDFFRGGHIGVEYFFVLSGFLMVSLHKFGETGALNFFRKRLLRIMPLYLVATLALLCFVLAAPGIGKARLLDPATILGNLTLIIHDSQLLIGAAWTLQREFVFYSVLALGFIVPRLGLGLFWLWQAAIILLNLIDPSWSGTIRHHVVFGVFNLGFGLGALIAISLQRVRVTQGLAAVIAVAGGLYLVGILVLDWHLGAGTAHDQAEIGFILNPVLTYVGAGAMLFGLIHMEARSGGFRLPWANALGGASYALYLTHGLTISIIVRLIKPNWGVNSELIFLISVIGSIGVATLVFRYVETPLLTTLRRLARRR